MDMCAELASKLSVAGPQSLKVSKICHFRIHLCNEQFPCSSQLRNELTHQLSLWVESFRSICFWKCLTLLLLIVLLSLHPLNLVVSCYWMSRFSLIFIFLLLLFLYCFTKGTPLIHHITYAIASSAIKLCIGLRLRQWTPALSWVFQAWRIPTEL